MCFFLFIFLTFDNAFRKYRIRCFACFFLSACPSYTHLEEFFIGICIAKGFSQLMALSSFNGVFP